MKRIFTLLVSLTALLKSFAITPTTPSTNLTSTGVEGNSITFSWTFGNGANRLIIARLGSPVTALPVNGIDYIANNTFGLGNEISTGQFVVYKGSNSSFGLNGLIPSSTYYIAIFEFNGTGFSTEYLTAAYLSGSCSTLSAPAAQVSSFTITNITGNSMKLNFTPGSGSSRLVLAKAGTPVDANPSDLVNYSSSSSFGAGDQIGSGNYVVAKNGTSATITDLQPNTTYYFAAFEFNGTSGPVYLTVAPATMSQATAPRPATPASNFIFTITEGNSMSINFTAGNGAKRLVIAKAGSPVTAVPADGATYTASTVFGSGQQIAPGEYVIANTANAFTNLSNLQHSTPYYFAVFEYDGSGVNTAYLTSSFLAGNNSTVAQPTVQTSNLAIGAVTNSSVTLTWVNGNGGSRIVVARQGSAVNALPVNYTNYGFSSFGSGSQIGVGNYVVYKGAGNTTVVTGLTFNATYYFTVFELNGNSAPVYLTSSPPVANATTSNAPSVPSSGLFFNSTEGNSMSLSWAPGNGISRIVVVKAGSPVTGLPVNGASYSASNVFGSGSTIAPGEFVVMNSAGSSININNLAIGTTYHVAIFEYNGSGAASAYLTSSFLAGNRTTLSAPALQTTSVSFGNIIGNAMQVTVSPGNGQNRLILVKAGSPVDAAPVNLTFYTASSTFGNGSQIGSGNYVILANSQSAVTLLGLQPGTVYYFASFEFNGSAGPVYNTAFPATGNATTLPRPTVSSSGLVFSNVEGHSMQLIWTAGNGTKRIVIARQGSPVTAVPADGTNYTANSIFGSGTEISAGQFVVANTTNIFVSVSNLTTGITYYFAIYEYDGTGANTGYLTSSFASGNASTVSAPTVQTSNLLFTNITNTSMTLNWTNGNGANRLVIASPGGPATAVPANLTAYSTSTNFSAAGQITPGNYGVYKGNGSSANIFSLQPNTTYYFSIFEYNGNTAPVYLTSSPVTGNASTAGAPQIQASSAVANAVNAGAATITWVNGSGHKRVVLMKANAAVDATPVDGAAYTANTFFGSGTQLGTGNYTVFNGTGNSVTVTNLNLSITYHVAVFEYNDFGTSTVLYLTVNPSRAIVALNAPLVQASNAASNAVTLSSARISWASGNGHKRIVLMKANAPVDAIPADNINYTADTVFAAGAQVGTGNYVVFNGAASSDTINGLNLANTYHVAVFEYNDFGVSLKRYQVNSPARTTVSAVPQVQASNAVVNIVNTTTAIIGWANGSGHKRIVLMKAGSAVDATPTDGIAFSASAAFGAGSQLGSGNYTVFNGTGNTVTVTGLVPGVTYHAAIFEYNDLGELNLVYLALNPARGIVTSGSLPVLLTGFTAKDINSQVLLQWSTAQEVNSLRFEAERSTDGINYTKIGSVNAAGNSSAPKDYSFTDNTAVSGIYYYRLRQVDINERFVYSKVTSVIMRNTGRFRLLENPVRNVLQLSVRPESSLPLTLSIFDMEGKQVMQLTMTSQNKISVDVHRLAAGLYVLQLAADKKIDRVKFLKTN